MKRMDRQMEMFSIIELYEHSNQTMGSFCKEHGIKSAAFSYWLRKYRKAKTPLPGFIAITPAAAVSPVRLVYPNGVTIELSGPDLSFISALVHLV